MPSLTALCPASVPVHIASVWPTNKPLFSPAQNKLSTPSTFISLVLGATERYLIELPLLPAYGSTYFAFSNPFIFLNFGRG